MNTHVGMRVEGEGVLFAADPIVKIGDAEITFLKEQALLNNRKSIRLCMHRDIGDGVHEMFILHSKETYVRPHKHPGKDVSYHIIEGVADMVLFDEQGKIFDVIPLGKYGSGRKFYYRLNGVAYYTPFVRSDFLLFHETIRGPFQRSDTIYAPWAAEGTDPDEVERFQQGLETRISQFRK